MYKVQYLDKHLFRFILRVQVVRMILHSFSFIVLFMLTELKRRDCSEKYHKAVKQSLEMIAKHREPVVTHHLHGLIWVGFNFIKTAKYITFLINGLQINESMFVEHTDCPRV